MSKRGMKKAITDYWFDYYLADNGLCSLCGNHGIIDTTGVKSPAGYLAGRKNWCICPNGQVLRYGNKGNLP